MRTKWPKLAGFIDSSEADVLSYLDFPVQHRTKIHSTNPIAMQHRYMQVEGMAELIAGGNENTTLALTA